MAKEVTEATIAAWLCGRDHTSGPEPCQTCMDVAMDVRQLVVPHIRAAERARVAAALDGCLSTLLARGRIDTADVDAIRTSIESETT